MTIMFIMSFPLFCRLKIFKINHFEPYQTFGPLIAFFRMAIIFTPIVNTRSYSILIKSVMFLKFMYIFGSIFFQYMFFRFEFAYFRFVTYKNLLKIFVIYFVALISQIWSMAYCMLFEQNIILKKHMVVFGVVTGMFMTGLALEKALLIY